MADQPLTILASGEIRPTLPDEIRAVAPSVDFRHHVDVAAMEAEIDRADVVASTNLSPAAFARAHRLKWIQSWAAGPDVLMYPQIVESPVIVTSCKGNGAIPLAEHALMLMLMLDREMLRSLAAQGEQRWDRFRHGELNGRTLGVIGTGYSGQDLAAKAKAFHMRVLGMRRTSADAPGFDEVFPRERLHAFLGACDFLVVTAPLTDETRGMLGTEEFAAMKDGAFYICISRGGIAADNALLDALRSGKIAGAGLDAHDVEPLPEGSPFWSLPNVIVTPHHGAVSAGTRHRGWDIFVENVGRYVRGEPLVNVVDKLAGY